VRAAGLTDIVHFLGRRDDAERVLPLFDIYLSTSLSEGTSMTILEAMACGLPVVASDVGGNRRLVDEATGSLYRAGDAESFVARCRGLALAPGRGREQGARGREKVESSFSLAQCVRAYEELYDEVLDGG
jgi:glycosyltransferase involved in cell wall biosynthesis